MPVQPLASKRLNNRVQASNTPDLNSLTGLAIAVVIIAALSLAREVLIPITLAVLLSFVLGPVVSVLRRAGLPRGLSVAAAILCALLVVGCVGAAIGIQVGQLSKELPRYAITIEHKISAVRELTMERMSAVTAGLGRVREPAPSKPATIAAPSTAPAPIPVEVHQPSPEPLEIARAVLLPVVSPLATAAIVFVVAIFVLAQHEDLRDRLIRLFGSSDLHRTTAALDDAGSRLGRYYLSLLAVNTMFGVVVGLGLFLIGVPGPILLGVIAALLRFVPYVGAIGGALIPILLAAAVDPGWTMVLATIALFVVVEPVLGQLVEPLIYGHSTGLSPISVVISAIFWGWIWGGIGLLLSMPLTLCLVVLGKHIKRLEFLEVLLGDQPALSPAESLYQRMLVGNAEEAIHQAEVLTEGGDLTAYYDAVVVPALRLAANDSLRDVLTERQMANIGDSVTGIITDLIDPAAVPAPTDGSVVLCIGSRGPLDEAVSTLLAQRLEAAGRRARVVPATAVSRATIGTLDGEDVGAVCLSYLEGTDSLGSLRYLVRRLRGRLGDRPIIVGLWSVEPAVLADERLRNAVGADEYRNSISDIVVACQAACKTDTVVAQMSA